jgi:hypothetical protein
MKLALKSRKYETFTASSSPFYYTNGLVELLGNGGSYIDNLLNATGFYKYAVVHGCSLTVKAVNTAAEPLILAAAPLPYNWTSGSPSVSELLDHPLCAKTTIGSSTGSDKGQISKFLTSKQVLGKDYQVAKYEMDYSQAISATPISTSEPVWIILLTAFNGATAISARVEIEFVYHVEFYNLTSA